MERGMSHIACDITRGTVSFNEAAYLCRMVTGRFWRCIKDEVVLHYPKLNEFFMSIAPYCLEDYAAPPEKILTARFPLQDILEMAVVVNDTSNVQDITEFVFTEYNRLYPPDEQSAPTTVQEETVSAPPSEPSEQAASAAVPAKDEAQAGADGAARKKEKPKGKRLPVTLNAAAKMCGVSPRTIQTWEDKTKDAAPLKYPGRYNLAVLRRHPARGLHKF
jgi:hypothetical protein